MAGRSIPPTCRERFLVALRQNGCARWAARSASVGRSTVYRWRDADPAFAEQWDNALAEAVDSLLEEAWRRGRDGHLEPIFYRGEIAGYKPVYSDRLLQLLLRWYRPDVYDPKRQASAQGVQQPVVNVNLAIGDDTVDAVKRRVLGAAAG